MRGATLCVALISLPALAQWQTIFVSTQLCVDSSRLSVSLSQAERAAAREKRARGDEAREVVVECETNDECEGYCIRGRCVDAVDETARVEPQQQSTPQPTLEPPNVARCTVDTQCAEGQSCMSGFCMSPPPPPSSLLHPSSELYVRQNVLQLRQDLALGEGPVISTLAQVRGISSRRLGKLMRTHRPELSGLVGDAADVSWPARFLGKVDELIEASS